MDNAIIFKILQKCRKYKQAFIIRRVSEAVGLLRDVPRLNPNIGKIVRPLRGL